MKQRTAKAGINFADRNSIRKIVFCSGKIFYHLYHARTAIRRNIARDHDSNSYYPGEAFSEGLSLKLTN